MLNKQHLPVLFALRRRIASGENTYMCLALKGIALSYFGADGSEDLVRQVRRHVAEAFDIGQYVTFNNWLIEQIFPLAVLEDLPEPYRSIALRGQYAQPMRLAWLDKTIWEIEHAE